jgi:hypothetical protein
VPLGAHPAVGEDLGDRVFGRRTSLYLVSLSQSADVIHRVEIADILERVGDAFDNVCFGDSDGHARAPLLVPARIKKTLERCGGSEKAVSSDGGPRDPELVRFLRDQLGESPDRGGAWRVTGPIWLWRAWTHDGAPTR